MSNYDHHSMSQASSVMPQTGEVNSDGNLNVRTIKLLYTTSSSFILHLIAFVIAEYTL